MSISKNSHNVPPQISKNFPTFADH